MKEDLEIPRIHVSSVWSLGTDALRSLQLSFSGMLNT